MAPQLLFLTLTVLAVAAVVAIDHVAGRLGGEEDEDAPRDEGDVLTITVPEPVAPQRDDRDGVRVDLSRPA